MVTHFIKRSIVCLVPLAAGCAGNVAPAGSTGDADAAMTTSAVVVVERTVDAVEGARAQASARFVRVPAGSSTQDAMLAIGATLELPARGQCASVTQLSGRAGRVDPAPVVELVDVGSVWLDVAGTQTRLAPRQVPDVTDIVSGVVYARAAADAALLPAAARYVVHVSGTSARDAVDVSVDAPADPSDITVAGEDGSGSIVARGGSIALSWPPSDRDDVVYADVQPGAVRCVLDGVARDARVRGSLSTSLLDDAGTILLHRVHRESIRAQGVNGGEIRFDFARSVAYVRR